MLNYIFCAIISCYSGGVLFVYQGRFISQFEKADDEGYKILCDCGWAGRQLRGWYSNKIKLIEKWNELIQEGEFTECQPQP